jgi:hypothetical protein
MAKAKRERRTSFRTMQSDQALEALDRIEKMERQEQQAAASGDPVRVSPENDPDPDES